MTAAGQVIAEEIAREGPMRFSRFMEIALYHPEHGYYRQDRERFGKAGDFYTAAQMQPVFGILMRRTIEVLAAELGSHEDFTVVDLGAGRCEMREAFDGFHYVPVDVGGGALPDRFTGAVFANEFFDALPVDVAEHREGEWRELLIAIDGDRFAWTAGPRIADLKDSGEEGDRIETRRAAIGWMNRIDASLDRGFVIVIDYGYTSRERVRFPQGTLMTYSRHVAHEDALDSPGERDITAHVDFSTLMDHAKALGWSVVRFEMLGETLLRAGEPDTFAAALDKGLDDMPAPAVNPRALQLKTLLFGMGQVFRTLLLRKEG